MVRSFGEAALFVTASISASLSFAANCERLSGLYGETEQPTQPGMGAAWTSWVLLYRQKMLQMDSVSQVAGASSSKTALTP